jgi:hypothetical protein
MPKTALAHFQHDLSRARAIVAHADPLPRRNPAEDLLRSDLLRSAWMFAVGALDAYFCDAHADLIAATLIAKNRQPSIVLPEFFLEIRLPVRAILEPYERENWRWRMAARRLMERESVLKLSSIQQLFNKFFRRGHRFFLELLPHWIADPESKKRLFGITRRAFTALATPSDRRNAAQDALGQFERRYGVILQRRHDCIHNCDRPRISPQPLAAAGEVTKVVQDVEFLVTRCNDHINTEFREFLLGIGCPPATVSQVGY